MISKSKIIIFFCLFLALSLCQKKLVFMTEISRHGARSPMYDNLNFSDWNYQRSDLTQVGMRQHYLLGRQFSKYYIDEKKLLDVPFDYAQVLVKTTSTARTQKSAQSQLMGWFLQKGENMPDWIKFNQQTSLPPQNIENGEQLYNEIGVENLPSSFQPIPVYGSDENYLNVAMEPAASCERINQIKKKNNYTHENLLFIQYLEQNGVLRRFKVLFGLSDNKDITIKLIGEYYDTIYCNLYQQLGLPEGVTEEDWDWIQFIYNYQQLYLNYGTELNLKLQATNYFREVLNQARKTIYLNDKVKFLFYSGSDNNVNTVNLALNITQYTADFQQWKDNQLKYSNVPFASTIIFEFYEDQESEEVYVLFKFNDQIYDICGNSEIQNSEEKAYCTFEEFESLLGNYILDINDYIQECGSL